MDHLFERVETACMVVAHPDDESLWGAGLILRYRLVEWKVVCCTIPTRDPERVDCFLKACDVLGVEATAFPGVEKEPIRLDLLKVDAGLIVTHNEFGEYGNPQHRDLHKLVAERWPEKTICFGFRPNAGGPRDWILELTDDERARKWAALRCYDNVDAAGRPTWERLMEAFGHKFNLWREPYEKLRDVPPQVKPLE